MGRLGGVERAVDDVEALALKLEDGALGERRDVVVRDGRGAVRGVQWGAEGQARGRLEGTERAHRNSVLGVSNASTLSSSSSFFFVMR